MMTRVKPSSLPRLSKEFPKVTEQEFRAGRNYFAYSGIFSYLGSSKTLENHLLVVFSRAK